MKNQLNLFDFAGINSRGAQRAHGGGLGKGKRKDQRPLSRKKPLHLVLKSRQAVGAWSFLKPRNRILIERILKKQSKKFGVVLEDRANMGHHLHIKLRASSRRGFQSFLRSVTCLIARSVSGARRGVKLKRRFWDELAFTRVLDSLVDVRKLRGLFASARSVRGRGRALARDFERWISDVAAEMSESQSRAGPSTA